MLTSKQIHHHNPLTPLTRFLLLHWPRSHFCLKFGGTVTVTWKMKIKLGKEKLGERSKFNKWRNVEKTPNFFTWISLKEMSMLWITSTLSTLGSSSLLFILLSCSFNSSPEYCSRHLARSDLNFSLRCSLDCTTSSFRSCFSLWTRVCWQEENPSPCRSPKMSENIREPSCCYW